MNQVIGSNLAFLENRDVPFVLGEVGTVISTSNSHQNSDLYNRLGSALWTLDFLLYGMSLVSLSCPPIALRNFHFHVPFPPLSLASDDLGRTYTNVIISRAHSASACKWPPHSPSARSTSHRLHPATPYMQISMVWLRPPTSLGQIPHPPAVLSR